MKKLIFAAFMLLSVGTFANNKKIDFKTKASKPTRAISGQFTSACGSVWNYTVTCNCTNANHLNSLLNQLVADMNAACLNGATSIAY